MKRKQWLAMALPGASALSAVALGAESAVSSAKKNANERRAEKQKVRGNRTFTIETCIREFSETAAEKTAQGWQFWFVPTDLSPTFNVKVTQVGPQSANHPPHAHPEEEIYYVLEGRAEFSLQGKTRIVGANSTMFCPPGMPHGIRNVAEAPLRYAVIKANYPKEK